MSIGVSEVRFGQGVGYHSYAVSFLPVLIIMSVKHLTALLTSALIPLAHAADATIGGPELARARNCLSCHQVDTKRVGPPYQGVAERYAGHPESESYLANSIRNGGRGKWGAVPMPVQPQVSDADAHALAKWILSLKPTP